MNLHLLVKLRQLSKSLSIKAGIYCVGAVGAALIAVFFAPYVPDSFAELLGGDAVDDILTILASSMLAVVTFSLSTLVATYSIVAGGAPPRATALIIEDSRAQSALSTFLGAFIFSIVSLVALSTKYYGEKGRVILFFITILVLAAVIWTIIRWIGQLSGLGRLGHVIDEVEKTAEKTIRRQPNFFAWQHPPLEKAPEGSLKVTSEIAGFLQTVDLKTLAELGQETNTTLYIEVCSGQFVHPNLALARFAAPVPTKDFLDRVRNCFIIGESRTFDEDPRFGFIVLSEIGSRALSPGINDPGTAIHVLASLVRLMLMTRKSADELSEPVRSDRLRVRRVTADEIFDDAFRAIARDGAGLLEVVVFLQKALKGLKPYPEFEQAADFQARLSLEYSQRGLKESLDLKRLQEVFQEL